MDLLVSHVILSIVVGTAGFCAGWWLHLRMPDKRTFVTHTDEGLIRELMSSLHGLSVRMAADVGEHSSQVGAVDRELAQVRGQNSSKVSELVDRLIHANRSVQTKLTETEGKLDQLSQKMEYQASEARTDVLTGLANRRAFQEESVCTLARFRETDEVFSLVMIDIDRFKQVNDVHGHPFGDEVLRGVGAILRENMRGRDLVTRYGGEEFAILMRSTSLADARRGAENVREIIEKKRFQFSGKSLNLTVSMGVGEIQPFEDMAGLLKRADQAMYAAKHAGRNRVYWHDGTLPHPLRAPQHRAAEDRLEHPVSEGTPAYAPPTLLAVNPTSVIAADTPHGLVEHSCELESDGSRRNVSDIDMDVLNNLGNKTIFCQSVHRRLAEFKRGGPAFATVLLRVDGGEEIARVYGDASCKMVLGVVAQAIRERLREMDFIARYNDFTFGMVLPEATLRNAICIGERLRKAIKETVVDVDGKSLRFTVSLGIVESADGDEMASLVERARGQLEQAQQSGGNRTGFAASALVAS